MDENPDTLKEVSPALAPRLGLAIASLVLGILALVLSLLIVGAVLGLVGLILGVVHIRGRRGSNAMAWWGVGLSIVGILSGIGLGVFYYHTYKKVVAAMESASSDEGTNVEEWEGVLAPDITVKTLDGQTIELSKLRGKRVVLDFWATWCPPCVKEIPHFLRLFNETSRDELMVIGISSEDESTLKSFVNKHGINYTIASAKDLALPYKDIQSIPTTFFIDRNGVIQSIAVGYHEFAAIKEHALAGDVKGEPKPPPSTPRSELKESSDPLTANEAWTTRIPGASALAVCDWDGDEAVEILVATADKRLHVLSAAGAEKAVIPLPDRFSLIEAGRHATQGARLLGYANWGHKVTIMDVSGREIWSYPSSTGVNGAHWGDLDGDKTDELIVGMNGSGGLHAVSAEGKKLWAVTDIGNVWNQAVIPATKDRAALIFATEAGGTVRVYDAKGKLQCTIRPEGKYCSQMAARVVDRDGMIQSIAIGGGKAIAFDQEGQVSWSTPSIKDHGGWRQTTFAGGDLNGDGQSEWMFHDASGGLLVASWQGEKLASLPEQAQLEDFTIVPTTNGKGMLVTLFESTLRAYVFDSTTKAQ